MLDFALDDQCTEGFSGPLCLVCAEGFVKQGDECTKCPQGASIGIAALPLVGMSVSLLVGLLLAFACGKTATKAKDSGVKWFGQAKVSYILRELLSYFFIHNDDSPFKFFIFAKRANDLTLCFLFPVSCVLLQ